ncbi:MAG TPA: hypothetical protein DEQ43_01155 [Nocardioides bacterium]|nr:hypothetical protein [Nocardioides sp.]
MVGRWSLGLATGCGHLEVRPRGPGAAMAVGPDGKVHGSVSGGRVEGAVYQIAREVLADEALRRINEPAPTGGGHE